MSALDLERLAAAYAAGTKRIADHFAKQVDQIVPNAATLARMGCGTANTSEARAS